MRKLFAALTRSALADRVSFSGNVLGKYSNYRSTNCRLFVEKLRGSLFDLFSQSEKLLCTRAAFCSLRSREFIKRGIADLTDDNLVVVQHEKPESVSFVVMPLDFVTDQRHGQHSPQTDAGSPRLPRPASQINGLTATLSRKLLTFLIALASIAFGVCSPAWGWFHGCASCVPSFSLAWVSHAEDSAGGTTVTYSSLSFGAAASNRIIAVAVVNRANNTIPTVSSMTIGGGSATQVASAQATDSGDFFAGDIWQAAVPTGTSGNVAITYSAASLRSGIDLYRIVTTTPTAASANGVAPGASATNAPVSTTVTIPSGGAALSIYGLRGAQSSTPSITWTNATSDFTATNVGGANLLMVGSATTNGLTGSTTITGQTTGNANSTPVLMSSAAWGP